MASARTIQLTPADTGLWPIRQSEDAAQKATELLQKDLENHHVFFNNDGFHNHISHHLLSLYGTGASPSDLQKGYNDNNSYQRPALKPHENPVGELKDWGKAKERLGKEEYYSDFLVFFQHEIDRLGWEKVLSEYLFKGDERSENMLVRMFSGVLHPIIQLMFGVEWKQPAIIAMGLAQAAVHQDSYKEFWLGAEEAAKSAPTPMPSIVTLLDEVRGNEKLSKAPKLEDANKIRDGVLARALDEIVKIAGRVKVQPGELEEKTAEMYNTCIYEGASAALFPGKDPKFDFFLMHHINVCPLFVTINSLDWVPIEAKVRMLEWKIRFDLAQYAARATPELSLDKIQSYVPSSERFNVSKDELLRIVQSLDGDDGHAIKLYRAVGVGQHVSKEYEDKDWMKIKGEDLWMNVSQMVADAVTSPDPRWVRFAGHPGAWEEVQNSRERL